MSEQLDPQTNPEPITPQQPSVSRRKFLETSSAVLVAAAGAGIAHAQHGQQTAPYRTPNHTSLAESEPLKNDNAPLDAENPNSVFAPATDAGGQPPFKLRA